MFIQGKCPVGPGVIYRRTGHGVAIYGAGISNLAIEELNFDGTDIEQTVTFIRKIKQVNPATELILYLYTPTPQEGSVLLDEAVKAG